MQRVYEPICVILHRHILLDMCNPSDAQTCPSWQVAKRLSLGRSTSLYLKLPSATSCEHFCWRPYLRTYGRCPTCRGRGCTRNFLYAFLPQTLERRLLSHPDFEKSGFFQQDLENGCDRVRPRSLTESHAPITWTSIVASVCFR